MSSCVLFIDGENFLNKVEEILKKEKIKKKKEDLAQIEIDKLLSKPLKEFNVSRKIFYVAKLHLHPKTKKKSKELISAQRKLRNNLVKKEFEFVISGNVRAQMVGGKIVFREKGVDVRIAVDLVSLACDKKLDTAIICSSDSDLQPAIKEIRKRGTKAVYLGFENNPNKCLIFTTNKNILLKNSAVIKSVNSK